MQQALILASTSPRRRALLSDAGMVFTTVAPMLTEERLDPALPLGQALEELALAKAQSVAETAPAALVMGADTLVSLDGVRLGKPRDAAEARQMLAALSGRTHEVITAVALCCAKSGHTLTAHSVSRVHFRPLSDEEISDYIASGEPFDKAGGYGIQGEAGKFVEGLEGDFDNVVGLPLALVKEMLDKWEEGVS